MAIEPGRRQFTGSPSQEGLAADPRAGSSGQLSRYLMDRIAALSNVQLVTGVHITGFDSSAGLLEAIRWRRGDSGVERSGFLSVICFCS